MLVEYNLTCKLANTCGELLSKRRTLKLNGNLSKQPKNNDLAHQWTTMISDHTNFCWPYEGKYSQNHLSVSLFKGYYSP